MKLREGVASGAITHARRAEDLFLKLMNQHGNKYLGQDLQGLVDWCQEIQACQIHLDQELKNQPVIVIFQRKLDSGA